MKVPARPYTEWTWPTLLGRIRLLVLYLDPATPSWGGRRTKVLYWYELKELIAEVERRGQQGTLI